MYHAYVRTDMTAWAPSEMTEGGGSGMTVSSWDARVLSDSDEEFSDSPQVTVALPVRRSFENHRRDAKRKVAELMRERGYTPYVIYVA